MGMLSKLAGWMAFQVEGDIVRSWLIVSRSHMEDQSMAHTVSSGSLNSRPFLYPCCAIGNKGTG